MRHTPALLATALSTLLAACGGGGDFADAPTGDDDPDAAVALDGAPDPDGGPTIAHGFVALLFDSAFLVEPQHLDVLFHAWTPSTVEPLEVLGPLERELASGAALAVGACGTVSKPAPPEISSVVSAATLSVSTGEATLALEAEGDGEYSGREEGTPADFLGVPLTLVAGAGSAPLGGPGTLALGSIPALTAESAALACTRGEACDLGVTVDAADELYVAIALGPVCRLDPAAAIAIPTDALDALDDGPHSLRLYAVRRGPGTLGNASYEIFSVHELGLPFDLTTP